MSILLYLLQFLSSFSSPFTVTVYFKEKQNRFHLSLVSLQMLIYSGERLFCNITFPKYTNVFLAWILRTKNKLYSYTEWLQIVIVTTKDSKYPITS